MCLSMTVGQAVFNIPLFFNLFHQGDLHINTLHEGYHKQLKSTVTRIDKQY